MHRLHNTDFVWWIILAKQNSEKKTRINFPSECLTKQGSSKCWLQKHENSTDWLK
jgi:hypothetical protein